MEEIILQKTAMEEKKSHGWKITVFGESGKKNNFVGHYLCKWF